MAKDSYSEISEYFGIPTVEQLILQIVMIDSSIDIGVKKIVYVKHWLRSLSLLFFSSVVYLYFLLLIVCYHVIMVK